MKELRYEVLIDGTREEVWNTVIGRDTYDKWVKAFSPGSTCVGEWKQGAEMLFWDPNMGGTHATLDVCRPFESILATHTNTVTKDGVRETKGEMTEKWIGSKEAYHFVEDDGQTKLEIVIKTDEAFQEMFDSSWPDALQNIKKLVEG